MPYVTEDLWQRLPRDQQEHGLSTIMLSSYPQAQPEWQADALEDEMEFLLKVVSRLRNARTSTPVNAPRACRMTLIAACKSVAHQRTALSQSSVDMLLFRQYNEPARACAGYGLTTRQQPPVHMQCSSEDKQQTLRQAAGQSPNMLQ